MDPVLMAGAWAAAILSVLGLGRVAWKAFVKAVETVIHTSIGRIWRDMDDIEKRLSALEISMQFVREQLEELRKMMQAHLDEQR